MEANFRQHSVLWTITRRWGGLNARFRRSRQILSTRSANHECACMEGGASIRLGYCPADRKVAYLTQQCRFPITELSVSYQSATSTLTQVYIRDWIVKSGLTIEAFSRRSRLFDLTLL
jgi:hypothetical protein